MEFLRPKDVVRKMKISRALLYNLINAGLFPKPAKFNRLSIWKDSEVEKVMDAYINLSEEEIKQIVHQIERARTIQTDPIEKSVRGF